MLLETWLLYDNIFYYTIAIGDNLEIESGLIVKARVASRKYPPKSFIN